MTLLEVQSHLIQSGESLLSLLSFRLFPFAVWLVCGAPIALRSKLGLAVLYVALAAAARPQPSYLIDLLFVGSYYVAAAIGLHYLAPRMGKVEVAGGALMVALAAAFLLVPSLILSGDTSRTLLLLPGWDLMLKGYGYLRDAPKSDSRPHIQESLFFLLVNPVLVYSERGNRIGDAAIDRRGLVRALGGILAIGLAIAALMPLAAIIRDAPEQLLGVAETPMTLALFGVVQLLGGYAAHSGLASVQIGMMLQLGYRIPERYNYPLLARTPMEFWQRWNTYVGSWAKRYIFVPITLDRRWRKANRLALGKATGFFLAFVGVGLLHDLSTLASNDVVQINWTILFTAAALYAGAWYALERVLTRVGSRLDIKVRALSGVLGRSALAVCLIAGTAVWS